MARFLFSGPDDAEILLPLAHRAGAPMDSAWALGGNLDAAVEGIVGWKIALATWEAR